MNLATTHDAEVAARFDQLVGRFKADVDSLDYRLAAVINALAPLELPAILDLGCGKGRFARHIERHASLVVGIDISSRMLSEAVGLPRAQGNATRLPFANASFDAVVAVETVEHIKDISAFITEARRVLRPGGRLVVIDKNVWSLNHVRPWLPSVVVKWIDQRRGRWMYPAEGPARERWFSPRHLCKQLNNDFDQVRVDFLLAPQEANRWVFRKLPTTRLMVCWTAVVVGGMR